MVHLWQLGPAVLFLLICTSHMVVGLQSVNLEAPPHKGNLRGKGGKGGRGGSERQQTHEGVNLCTEGKLLPELYLLGSQKAGTTTFSEDMDSLGIEHVGGWKEFHFFDKEWEDSVTAGDEEEHLTSGRDAWLHQMPPCPTEVPGSGIARRVMADYTPSNIRSVPLPKGTRPSGSHWGLWFLTHNESNFDMKVARKHPMNLPRVLSRFYGHHMQKRLTFVVMLREGLSRMQSAWYSAYKTDEVDKTQWYQCRDCKAPDFKTALANTLDKAEQKVPSYDDWLWTGMYARQLESWMAWFEPWQFYIVPFRNYVLNGGKSRICRRLMQRVVYEDKCEKLDGTNTTENWHAHPDLWEDLAPGQKERFHKIMKPENDHLFRLLGLMRQRGAHFDDLDERGSSDDEIRKWLVSGW